MDVAVELSPESSPESSPEPSPESSPELSPAPPVKQYSVPRCCMLCFGQSAFFRFNHPEEAFMMKSMMPQGGGVSTGDYRRRPGTEPFHRYIYTCIYSCSLWAEQQASVFYRWMFAQQ
ncbi:Pleckstrin y-like domain family B member 1 [Liparis tanakae]|uniref:Pleckstrin y-like domain family B member 1 n=1 Tax=Liparis tanakae TaxID=230148 RepID=A0A4Z2F684_9TELE|nr:Pleckstrin y-like domain family B member 1 [Liparis tanakae]